MKWKNGPELGQKTTDGYSKSGYNCQMAPLTPAIPSHTHPIDAILDELDIPGVKRADYYVSIEECDR